MKVISTESSQVLAARVAGFLGVPLVEVKFSRFPDGEHYLKTGALDDNTLIIGSVPDNDALVQLLLLIDACDTSRVRLVIPYMAYARQDKRFNPGEPVSARAISRALGAGVSEVFTVNIHEPAILGNFGVPVRNLSLAPDIGAYIAGKDLDNPLILAPDEGAALFAEGVAAGGGFDCDHLEKTRLSGESVRMAPKRLDAGSRTVVIVDDIISTGGTIATATQMLYDQGATEVYTACVHGVFTGGAYIRLIAAGIREISCSDTLERVCSRYSAAERISAAVKR
ncbi:MAG: ribose-phosphate diphosphokinase [Methanoregulaceae archaeon]